jgi:DNA ligase-1
MFKPLLAATLEDPTKLRYPLLASPKLDGIRAIVRGGILSSRTLKPIPNKYTRELFSRPEFEGLDGELIVGDPTHPEVFNRSTSGVMNQKFEPDVRFWVFDHVGDAAFQHRLKIAKEKAAYGHMTQFVEHVELSGPEQLIAYEAKAVELGFEGIMLRSPLGRYKFGRSTEKEQILLKVKRFEDDEAVILDVIEQMTNTNEAKKDALGHTDRSTAKAGLKPAGIMGALRVRNTTCQEFEIGTGFTLEQRKWFWENRAQVIGRIIKYRYQKSGMKDLPRFPSYIGFRED